MTTNTTHAGGNPSDTTDTGSFEWLPRPTPESPPDANNPPSTDIPLSTDIPPSTNITPLDITKDFYLTVEYERSPPQSYYVASNLEVFPGQVVSSIHKRKSVSLFQLVAVPHGILDHHLPYA